MSRKVDIAYIISHGFAARMLLQTDLLGKLLQKDFKVAVITPDKNDPSLLNYAVGKHIEIIEYNPRSSMWTGEYMRLRKYLFEDIRKNPALWEKHLRDLHNAKQRDSFVTLFKIRSYYLIYLLVNNFPILRKLFSGFEEWSLKDPVADTILQYLNPRLLIATYPVNLTESRLLLAGNKAMGTSTVIHLLSWDNITSKGYFAQLADQYISWGNIMKEEFIEYYKIPEQKIFNTGVPHFDLHKQVEGSVVYKDILSKKGLDSEIPYLFFALGAPYFSPTEIDIAEWLAKKIEEKAFGELQLLLRPHPQNLSSNAADTILVNRLKALETKHVKIDWPQMLESNLKWSLQSSDMFEFAHLLEGCKLSINSGSTVSIDSLLHEKPVIQPLFDVGVALPWWQSVVRVKDYKHCKKLVDLGGVTVTNNFKEFAFELDRYLKDPAYQSEKKQNARYQEVGINDGKATDRVVSAIEEIINNSLAGYQIIQRISMQDVYKKKLINRLDESVSLKPMARILRWLKNYKKRAVLKLLKESNVKFTEAEMFTGDIMNVVVPDKVSNALYLNGCFEADDSKALIESLNEGDTFIDIGAHIGYYSMLACRLLGDSGKVICFEPTPSSYGLLVKNLQGKENVKAENLAVYSVQTNMEFNDYGLKYMVFNSFKKARLNDVDLAANHINVQTTTLDNYCRLNNVKPSFIKIDAESVELHVLLGAMETIEKFKPAFMIEVGDFEHIDAGSSYKIISFLTDLGYDVFEYNGVSFAKHEIIKTAYPTRNLYFFPQKFLY